MAGAAKRGERRGAEAARIFSIRPEWHLVKPGTAVIPAEAGIQGNSLQRWFLDPGFRRDDEKSKCLNQAPFA
jgi:hypothetical protein